MAENVVAMAKNLVSALLRRRLRWPGAKHRDPQVGRVGQAQMLVGGLLLLSLALGLVRCGVQGDSDGFLLHRWVERGLYTAAASSVDGLVFHARPELAPVTFAQERRPAVLTPAGTWLWNGRIPERARLRVGFQLVPEAWRLAKGVELRVEARHGDQRQVLGVAGASAEQDLDWLDLEIDLARFAGEQIRLAFTSRVSGPPAEGEAVHRVAWAPVSLATIRPAPAERPNVLLLVVDTLRADRLNSYGYQRRTSPNLQRLVAEKGVVFEHAYSQAPWTLPSAISYMTSRYPGELLGENPSAFVIPTGVDSLAEVLADSGYETAAFIANPTLSEESGFHRGFRTFYSPPQELDSLLLHAGDEVNPRAVRWLRAFQSRPFFLYVHYLDPHDPYDNADIRDGTCAFDPGYEGSLSGNDVHAVYAGQVPLTSPQQDVAHLSALYDAEVCYVDRHVGELLASLDPAALANTLVVFTSDHGEELFEHGGWKHGQSLYEHQIHVPLLMRWDRGLPAGKRETGTVRLLDLVPTLAAAVGAPISPAWSGENLLPALRGEHPLPELSAYSQNHSHGPLRASVVLGRNKLILFDARAPFLPEDGLVEHLWMKDLARLEPRELYDLSLDPAERRNLAQQEPELLASSAAAIYRQLDRQLNGLRIVASSWPEVSRVGGRILFDRPPEGWTSLFLASGDQVRLRGPLLELELEGEALPKGILVRGEFASLLEIELTLNGEPLSAGSILLGPGESHAGGSVPREALQVERWVDFADRPTVRLWMRAGGSPHHQSADNAARTEKALRALGYIE